MSAVEDALIRAFGMRPEDFDAALRARDSRPVDVSRLELATSAAPSGHEAGREPAVLTRSRPEPQLVRFA